MGNRKRERRMNPTIRQKPTTTTNYYSVIHKSGARQTDTQTSFWFYHVQI